MPDAPKPPVDRFLIRLEVFDAWNVRVERRNMGKVGAPFRYPPELFRFLAWVRLRSGLDYRALAELARELLDKAVLQLRAQNVPEAMLAALQTPHFTQIRRRVEQIQVPESIRQRLGVAEPVHVVLDTPGVRILSRPEFERWVMRQAAGRGFASATRPTPVRPASSLQLSKVASTVASPSKPAKS